MELEHFIPEACRQVESNLKAAGTDPASVDPHTLQLAIDSVARRLHCQSYQRQLMRDLYAAHMSHYHSRDGVTQCDGGCRW